MLFEAMFCHGIALDATNLSALSLLLVAGLWRWYVARRDRFIAYQKRDDARGIPLTFPYVFPLLGSLPITYIWNPRAFVLNPE